jgi:hypothetical protein
MLSPIQHPHPRVSQEFVHLFVHAGLGIFCLSQSPQGKFWIGVSKNVQAIFPHQTQNGVRRGSVLLKNRPAKIGVSRRQISAISAKMKLEQYPQEILLHLAKMLSSRDVVALSLASHFYHRFLQDESLWKYLHARDFPDCPKPHAAPGGRMPQPAKKWYIEETKYWRLVVYGEICGQKPSVFVSEDMRLFSPFQPRESYILTNRTNRYSGPGCGEPLSDLAPLAVIRFNMHKYLSSEEKLFGSMKKKRFLIYHKSVLDAIAKAFSPGRQLVTMNSTIFFTEKVAKRKIQENAQLDWNLVIIKGDDAIHKKFIQYIANPPVKKSRKKRV